jgi:hypothetical protein
MAVLTADGTGRYVRWGASFGWHHDTTPADWIGPRLHPFAQDVGSVIPEGFAAYGRLFHPVELHDPDSGRTARERWSDIARRNRRLAHAEMQFHMISRHHPEIPAPRDHRVPHQPRSGQLPLDERRILVEVLRGRTATSDRCWFCLWEGYGGLDDGGVHERVRLPGRDYVLYGGPIDHALDSPCAPLPFDLSPNLWWPEDRAWLVATEIDFCWTYVGGTRELIETLVTDPRLEVLEAKLSGRITIDGDRENEALDRRPGSEGPSELRRGE